MDRYQGRTTNFIKWSYSVLFNGNRHLEETIQEYLNNRNEPIVEVQRGMHLVNNIELAKQVLVEPQFDGKGRFDTKFGRFSFLPFTLQQLTDGEQWQR